MIRTELYYDFRLISKEDYTEQINFYEKYNSFFEKIDNFENLKSRTEFLRRINILYQCAYAYSKTYNYDKSINIFNIIITIIEKYHQNYNIDLAQEHYYIDSIFEKGKALYNLSKYYEAENCFKEIQKKGYANYIHINWYIYSRNARLLNNLNNIILFLSIVLLISPKLFSLKPSVSFILTLIVFPLIILYLLNPSKKLGNFFAKVYLKKYKKKRESRLDPIAYYSKKIENNLNDYDSFIKRAIEYNLHDDYEKSLSDLNIGLSINPTNIDALYYRAIAYGRLNMNDLAIEDLTKLIELKYSNIAEIYNNRGTIYLDQEKYKLALDDYSKAIELEPYEVCYVFNRADLYQIIGQNIEAIKDYNEVLKLEPDNYMALTMRGDAYYSLGIKDKAFNDFLKAKEFNYKEAIDKLNKYKF